MQTETKNEVMRELTIEELDAVNGGVDMAKLVSNPTDPAKLSELQMMMSERTSQLSIEASLLKSSINSMDRVMSKL